MCVIISLGYELLKVGVSLIGIMGWSLPGVHCAALTWNYFLFTSRTGAKYCDWHICEHISKTKRPDFTKFSVHVAHDHDSFVLVLWMTWCLPVIGQQLESESPEGSMDSISRWIWHTHLQKCCHTHLPWCGSEQCELAGGKVWSLQLLYLTLAVKI